MKTALILLIWISVGGIMLSLSFFTNLPTLLLFFVGILFGIIGRLAHDKVKALRVIKKS